MTESGKLQAMGMIAVKYLRRDPMERGRHFSGVPIAVQ